MKKLIFSLSVILLLSMTMPLANARDAVEVLDTPKAHGELLRARQLAGEDKYLQVTQLLQCRDLNADGVPTGPQNSGTTADVEPLQVFDNLYYIGGPRTGGWLFTTPDGYILLDAMYGDSPETTILPNMEKLGLDPALIQYILVTHAGPDHVGGAEYFQEKYGTRVIMSQRDWDSLLDPQPGDWILRRAEGVISPASKNWRGPPRMDIVGLDGQTLTLGDITVTMIETPRRVNGGGLSYIVPVTDNGTPHMFATYGNTNVVGEIADKELYRESVAHWVEQTDTMNVDVVISSHPFVDGSIDRMAELRNRKPAEANPFVIGKEGARRYFDILDQCAALAIARANAGLDMTGTERLE